MSNEGGTRGYDVIVCKTGRAVYFEGARHRASAQSETGDTEGCVIALRDAGYKVLLVAPTYGKIPDGVDQLWFDLSGINHDDPVELIKPRFDSFVEQLRAAGVHNGQLWIDVSGSCVEECLPWNPSSVKVQLSALRYSGSLIHCMAALDAVRVAVIGDVRSYPRDGAMHWLSDAIRPVAVLSQRSGQVWKRPKRVGPLPMKIYEVDARVDTWWPRPIPSPRIDEPREGRCLYVANCHLGSGFRQSSREAAHAQVLGPGSPVEKIAGEGWEHWPNAGVVYEDDRKTIAWVNIDIEDTPLSSWVVEANEFNSADCRELMGHYRCAPIIGGRDWGRTTKISELISAGCVPLPYGRPRSGPDREMIADEHVADRDCTFFPPGSALRWETTEELAKLAALFDGEEGEVNRVRVCRELERRTRPDHNVLLSMVRTALCGINTYGAAGVRDDSQCEGGNWTHGWGGYQWVVDPWADTRGKEVK